MIDRVAANTHILRDAAGWTQEEAAHRCDEMPIRVYQMVERGQANVTARTLARLCHGFSVDPVALLAPSAPRAKRKAKRLQEKR